MPFADQSFVQVSLASGVPVVRYDPESGRDSRSEKTVSSPHENNTYINWRTETSRTCTESSSVSKKWATIVVLALIAGYITTFIDLTSVWLNDLKKGLCFSKIDKWSLLDPYLTCPKDDWYDWSRVLFSSRSIATNVLVNFPIYLLFATAWVTIAAYIVIRRDPWIKQSGIPEIKLIIAGFNYDLASYLGIRTLLYKTLGLIFVVSSGMWLGKEGPLVHVSCCILNVLYDMVFSDRDLNEGVRRELLSAATATGISLAFNSPIGGVLFVLECIPSFFTPTKIMWNSFVSATIGVVVLTGFKLFTEGENFQEKELFEVHFGNFSWLFLEIVPFIFLGVLGGIYGHYYTKLNLKFSRPGFKNFIQSGLASVFRTLEENGRYLEILLVVFVTTVLNFPLNISRLPLLAYLKLLFTECPVENTNAPMDTNSSNFMCQPLNVINILKLAYIVVQGFILSAYSFSLPLPGGVLMPSLVLGATSGRILGILSQLLQTFFNSLSLETCTSKSCLVSPSSYAVVGAASFMTGITKLTMCVVVIIFETTGAITYVLPIMLSVMALKFVSDYMSGDNIYDSWLKAAFNTNDGHFACQVNQGKSNGLCGFSNLTQVVKNKLPDVTIDRVMVKTEEARCLYLFPEVPYNVRNLYQFLSDDNHEGYPLIASRTHHLSLGYISKQAVYDSILQLSDSDSPVSFQVKNLPASVLSQQVHYEQSLAEPIIRLDMVTETSHVVINTSMPIVLVLDMFEKLSLNYLIVFSRESKSILPIMSGFIDRFMLARLINSEFEELRHEADTENAVQEFEVDEANDFEADDLLLNLRRDRESIELLS